MIQRSETILVDTIIETKLFPARPAGAGQVEHQLSGQDHERDAARHQMAPASGVPNTKANPALMPAIRIRAGPRALA